MERNESRREDWRNKHKVRSDFIGAREDVSRGGEGAINDIIERICLIIVIGKKTKISLYGVSDIGEIE